MSRRGIASIAVVASLAFVAAVSAAPASAQTDNWAQAAIASSEFGPSINLGDPTGGQLPTGGVAVGTSECTSTLEGLVNTATEVDDLLELVLSLVWIVLGDAGVPVRAIRRTSRTRTPRTSTCRTAARRRSG